jgi:catechol 2,3-dioxygenase-like lactoylglutathione lyase family enzyme
MNHFTVVAQEPGATLNFYCGLLGLIEGDRPPFDFPGAWLYAPGGGGAILHLVFGRPLPEPRTGVIDHMAFNATGLRATLGRLEAAGVKVDLRRLPGDGSWQLFCHDPNGARVELDFAADETP